MKQYPETEMKIYTGTVYQVQPKPYSPDCPAFGPATALYIEHARL